MPGVAAAVNGLDNAWAGLKTIWTGEGQDTYTQQAIGAGVERLTGSKTAAAIAETTVGILGPKGIIGLGQATGRVGRKLLEQAAERLAATKAAEQVAAEAAEVAAREAGEKASQVSGTIASPSTGAAEGSTSTISQNASNGRAFERAGLDYLNTVQTDLQEQVSVRPYINESGELASYRVRLDALGLDDSGVSSLTDFKSSATAGFTPNQTTGYPLIEQFGGQVVGNNGGVAFPKGFQIPPSPVIILRPGDF